MSLPRARPPTPEAGAPRPPARAFGFGVKEFAAWVDASVRDSEQIRRGDRIIGRLSEIYEAAGRSSAGRTAIQLRIRQMDPSTVEDLTAAAKWRCRFYTNVLAGMLRRQDLSNLDVLLDNPTAATSLAVLVELL